MIVYTSVSVIQTWLRLDHDKQTVAIKQTLGGFGRVQNENWKEASPMVAFFLHTDGMIGRTIPTLPFDYEMP